MQPAEVNASNAFAELVGGFCSWCEGTTLGPAPAREAARWLAKLYASALQLPDVGPENSRSGLEVPPEGLTRAEANLSGFRGWYYREYFDPHPHLTDESGMGDVGDDLLDTYKDLRSGLVAYERGLHAEALWHWSFLHRVHWGRHAVGAMFAIHCMSVAKAERA